ncbi:uncharacterized protein LOC132262585 [Phlebotomus argentipes]|uniref:uncharacterized protein LOC132262585 n=1 Tax=Phlebotomus argentipes TaxID=94469 RepID=UPI0028932607|nr:uncharacterized protein LOC132262585 [Phlebotomus argentipes]
MEALTTSSSDGSLASRSRVSTTKISVKESPGYRENDFTEFTDEQLGLIEETLNLILWEKFGCVLEDEELPANVLPETRITNGESVQNVKITRKSQENEQEKVQNIILDVTEIQDKIIRCLCDVQSHIQRCVRFDEDEEIDAQRRRRRFEEFSTRLSRNYLYRVSCLTADISSTRSRKLMDKTNKLFTAILRAFRFYCSNMTNYSNEMQQKKLMEMCQVVLDGINTCLRMRIFDRNDEMIKEISDMCMDLIRESKKFCDVTKKPLMKVSKPNSTKKKKTSALQDSLSMYLPQRKTSARASYRTPSQSLRLNLQTPLVPQRI